jgi:hypothetical protein
MLDQDQRSAINVDQAAVKVLCSRGVIDIALGEALGRLFRGDRLLQLGYSKQVDYSRERLGIPPRTMFGWVRLARELGERPILRKAVLTGQVSARKALAIFPSAIGKEEGTWTAAAMTSSLAVLEAAVRQDGKRPGTEEHTFEVEVLWLRMDEEQQERLEAAIAVARKTLSLAAPRWQCEEAIWQEWLGTHGAWCPGDEGEHESAPEKKNPKKSRRAWRAAKKEMKKRARAVLKQLDAIEEANSSVVEGLEESTSEDALSLDALIQRLLKARMGFDEAFGALALQIVEGKVWATLGFHNQGDYVPQTLPSTIWSASAPEASSNPMRAFRRRWINASKESASSLVLSLRPSTTWQQMERDTTKEEDRRNREAGVRRVWGPKDAAETMALAIASAQALHAELGEPIDEGEAVAAIADHFVEVWSEHEKGIEMGLHPESRRKALMRHGGLCAVPGCSRPAEHLHHGVYRSRGGPDAGWNLIGICSPHHLHGVHKGYLTVKGRAGELLVWRLGLHDAVPLEEWVTSGDDDVRRLDRDANPGGASFVREPSPPEYAAGINHRAASG